MATAPAFDPATVEAVVFDVGGVFIYPDPAEIRAEAVRLGLVVPDDDLAFVRAHHAACRALSDRDAHPDEHHPAFWDTYDRRYRTELGLPSGDGDGPAIGLRVAWSWPHRANIEAFHRLAATGMPVAVVSNNDGTAAEQLVRAGVCQVGPGPLPEVVVVVDSTLVGVAKPHPDIFRPALDALGAMGVAAARTLYVGDTVHADVHGARAAGLQVVQLDPFAHHADLDHHRVPDLAALVELLLS